MLSTPPVSDLPPIVADQSRQEAPHAENNGLLDLELDISGLEAVESYCPQGSAVSSTAPLSQQAAFTKARNGMEVDQDVADWLDSLLPVTAMMEEANGNELMSQNSSDPLMSSVTTPSDVFLDVVDMTAVERNLWDK